jgi:uncharacterized protein (TIGR03437 family)
MVIRMSSTPFQRSVLRRLTLGILPLLAAGVSSGQAPAITAVTNAASGNVQGLPNGGIAQGAVFVVFGTNLGPSALTFAASAFQTNNVGGTSVSVTVNTTTVNAPMYYASASQVAALLPSDTPTGSGTLTLTYNGIPSATAAVTVVQNNLGIFTLSENGQGVAVVTYPNYSLVSSIPGTGPLAPCAPNAVCPYTFGGAANPGDVLTIWATGLGPISGGSDASGAGLGQTINVSLNVWVGGVEANVTYHGRSGYIGEDQINFVVPSTVPLGCAVPLAVQIGTEISNYTAIPIASGSRSCTMQSPAFSSAAVQALTTGTGPINYASFELGRTILSVLSASAINYEDIGVADFAKISLSYPDLPNSQPEVLSSVDVPPLGTCTTSNSQTSAGPLFTILTGIDAGAITVTGPNGPEPMQEQPGTGQATTYDVNFSQFSASGVYFSGGAYTIAAAGDAASVGAFTIPFTITQTPSWPSSDQSTINNSGTGITRANGVTITWTGGSSAYWVEISGSSAAVASDIPTSNAVASFSCWVPSITTAGNTNGTFTVPASVLLALPGAADGEIDFKPTLPPIGFSASGLDVGFLLFQYQTSFFTPFN